MIRENCLLDPIGREDKVWHLSQAALVEGLPLEDLLEISELFQDQIFTPGEVVFDQGEPANFLYFLNRGSVRLMVRHSDDREKTVEILRGGDMFGLESVGQERHFKVRAVSHEESWISVLTREQFLRVFRHTPGLSLNLIQILIRRLADAHDEIGALCFLDVEQRLIRTLLNLGQTHGQELATQKNMVKLKLRLSHDYLARLIGSNRPYLSNIMSTFKKKGWVRYRRNYLLIDVGALRTHGSSLQS